MNEQIVEQLAQTFKQYLKIYVRVERVDKVLALDKQCGGEFRGGDRGVT